MNHAAARAVQRDAGLRLRWDILEALATYQIMTADLMLKAGIGRDVRRVREAARALSRLGLIAFQEGKFQANVGFLDGLYWLKPKGVHTLATEGITAHCTRRKALKINNDLRHRLAIVEGHIALRRWAATVDAGLKVVQDFDSDTPGRQKATTIDLHCLAAPGKKVGSFIPDMLAKVTLADGITRLLVIEIERGGDGAYIDLSEFRRWKLPKSRKVAESEELETALRVDNRARYVLLCKDAGVRDDALKKWADPDAEVWADFYVKALDEASGDFNGGWWQPGRGNRRCDLFQLG